MNFLLLRTNLKNRFWQASRIFWEIGLVRWVLILAIIVVPFSVRLAGLILNFPEISAMIWLSILWSVQSIRNDKVFFKLLQSPTYWIFFTEYLLISLPLLIYLAQIQAFVAILIAFGGLSIIPFSSYTLRRQYLHWHFLSFLPTQAFEWKSGFRLQYASILLIWGGSLVFSFYWLAVPVGVFLLLLISSQFYTQAEDLTWLRLARLAPRLFLFQKIKLYAQLFFILITPLSLAFLFFHPEMYYLLIGMWIAVFGQIVLVVLTKYAFYEPEGNLSMLQWIYLLLSISILIPFFAPLPIFFGFRFYRKAIKNLSDWL